MQNLVIVESPTKARTLSKYLGSKYRVEASMGHIRDLPKSEIGVDVEHNFEPRYIIPRDKKKRVNELKKLAEEAKNLWLATDPDREGEAIAWHLSELLSNPEGKRRKATGNEKLCRVVFHEITQEAIMKAFEKPRGIDLKLVDAQQARRVLDRLVGYKLSPLLWKKVKSGLSAGRVQSVAVRLVVDREREIKAFTPQEYWSIDVELKEEGVSEGNFVATLAEANGEKVEIKNEQESNIHVQKLKEAKYKVVQVLKKEVKRYSAPPFTTSTLQQAASNKLGMSAKKTMSLAQNLYEHGLITYMRTDSVNLSAISLTQARDYIQKNFGKSYLPSSAKVYKTKSKMAQEAHEAIRPTSVSVTVENLHSFEGVTRDHIRLYDLIWKRMVASQMTEAVFDATTVEVNASNDYRLQSTAEVGSRKSESYLLKATGALMKFEGWLKIYGKSAGEQEKEDEEELKEQLLPEFKSGVSLDLVQINPEQHFTEGPARFTDASLIKKLEELGIGRPSTYAPTLSTIQDRFYVEKVEKKFTPTELGLAVTDFLVTNFAEIINYDFTAALEDELDEIAQGVRQWKPTISKFYQPFEKKLEVIEDTAQKVEIASEVVDKKCPKCGKNLVIKYGKYGKFLACSGFPDCKHTESLEENFNIKCPDCGGEVVMRKTRKGAPFYGCKNYPKCKFASWTKPK